MITEEILLTEHLKKIFGFSKFKGQQEAIVQNVLDGKDVFVIMPTGGGKSLCYQLPALMSEGTAIVVSPLIALMKNQVDAIRGFGNTEGVAHFFNSSLSKGEREKVKSDIVNGVTKILYVAPESLTKEENVQFLQSIKISFFAIDEAHCISEWGHDFRPEYRRLRPIIEEIDRVPIIALTATATPKVQQDILKNLGMQGATIFKDSFNRANLYYEIRPKKDINKEIIKFVRQHQGKSGIVYCQSRKKVEEIAEMLQVNGVNAVPYHAGLDAKMRARHQDMFLMEEIQVIVATIAFGMGIDKPDIRYVIHHDIPKSLESYYQETGRAGRDGGEGKCIAFYAYDDILKLEKLLSGKPLAEQEINKLLMQEVVAFSETSNCRRRSLLHYFGEEYQAENCENCDNCLHPKERFDASAFLKTLLETIEMLNDKFKPKHIVQVLLGEISNSVKQYKHEQLDVFGKGAEEDAKFWNAIIRQALVANFIGKEIENYGTLFVTNKGKDFIKHPETILFTKDRDFVSESDEEDIVMNQKGGGALDPVLHKMLLDLRKEIAKKLNLPPYIIFQEPTIEELSTQYPTTLDEIKTISGVGEGKAIKYGKPFVDLIAKYVEENNIERPFDITVKTVANKSAIKVALIQNIDRKINLENFAISKGITLDDVLTELESIVFAGTKIDINYQIDEIIDHDEQEEMFDLLRSSEVNSIQPLLDEYGDVYEESELRMVRVKFLSDMGN